MVQKIGIMGGTFNPIHKGHTMIAEEAYRQYSLDKVIFIPNGNPYLKSGVLSKYIRFEMVKLAISDFPYFDISSIEIDKEGNSYSYETINEIKATGNIEIYFIIGADSLLYIENWKCPEEIFNNSIILVAKRPGSNDDDLKSKIAYLQNKYKADIRIINVDKADISSTDIRDKVKNNMPVSDILDTKVYDYIIEKGLYKE